MKADKVRKFLRLAGQTIDLDPSKATPELRALAAQVFLSEALEYVTRGLGVEVKVGDSIIKDTENLGYIAKPTGIDKEEMLDGLADIGYTMYWNSETFGMKIEQAFEIVCDNNLEKFIKLTNWQKGECDLPQSEWHCEKNISCPENVVRVHVVKVENDFYAVGKDARGKVRKPSTYKSVDLSGLCA